MLTAFVIVLVDLIGFGLYIPLLPFIAERYDATPFMVGLVMASFSLGQFIAAPLWGRISDQIGRRPVLALGMAGSAVSYIWLGYADALWMIFAARLIAGLMAGNITAAFAYMADITTPEDRAKGMGVVGAAFGLGFIAGPAIGGVLAGADPATADFRTPALVAAALSGTAMLMTLTILKESLSAEVRAERAAKPRKSYIAHLRDAMARPAVGRVILLMFLATFVFAALESTFAMWSRRAYGWGPEQNGYLFAFVGVLSAIIQGGLVGRMARRFGEPSLVVQGAASLAIGVCLIPFATQLPVLLAAMVVAGYGFSIMTPSLNSLVSLQTNEEEQGGALGISRSASTLARVAGPAWGGMLFSVLGRDWPYFGGAIVMVVVVLLALRLRARLVREARTAGGTP